MSHPVVRPALCFRDIDSVVLQGSCDTVLSKHSRRGMHYRKFSPCCHRGRAAQIPEFVPPLIDTLAVHERESHIIHGPVDTLLVTFSHIRSTRHMQNQVFWEGSPRLRPLHLRFVERVSQ